MHTKKFVHTFFYMFVIAMISNITQCASEQVAKGDDIRSRFLTPERKIYSVPFAIGAAGCGAHTLSSQLPASLSWRSTLPAIAVASSPLWLNHVQAQYRKKFDPKHENLLSKWWLPAAGTFSAMALLSAYKNNLLPGLACGAILSAPAAWYGWKLKHKEDVVQEIKKLIYGVRSPDEDSFDKTMLLKALERLDREQSDTDFMQEFTADSNITMGQMDNIIKNYPLIDNASHKDLLEKIIFQKDMPKLDQQDHIKTLEKLLNTNQNILETNPTAIKEHDFIKLFSSLNFLRDDAESYKNLGKVLSLYNRDQIQNLVHIIHVREDLLKEASLAYIGQNKARKIEQLINEAQQVWQDEQKTPGETSISLLQSILEETLKNRLIRFKLGDSSKFVTALNILKRKGRSLDVGSVLSLYDASVINNLLSLIEGWFDPSEYAEMKQFVADAQNEWKDLQKLPR